MKQMATALVLIAMILCGTASHATDSQKFEQLRKQISAIEEEIAYWRKNATDDSVIFISSNDGVAVNMSRDQYGAWLAQRRINDGWTDQKIAEHQSANLRFSHAYKQQLLKDFIPGLEKELSEIRTRLEQEVPPVETPIANWDSPVMPFDLFMADSLIGGDWILSLEGHDNIFYVHLDETRKVFVGSISVSYLEYHRQGDVVFEVTPVKDSPGRFQGTEFSYDDQGAKVRIPLNLEVKGNILCYRSRDQALQLVRR